VLVARPGSERPDRGGKRLHVPDFLPALHNALRAVAALASVELFWIATAWPDGPTMITFTAVGVILFSPRAEAAYPSVVEYAAGTKRNASWLRLRRASVSPPRTFILG
jgi:uncharacterized membrane protein YccC